MARVIAHFIIAMIGVAALGAAIAYLWRDERIKQKRAARLRAVSGVVKPFGRLPSSGCSPAGDERFGARRR